MPTSNIKSYFQLEPNVTFLNHGSFGACPKPVFSVYHSWQRRLERQPVRFLGRELRSYDSAARQALASHLHVNPEDLVYIPNATHGVNIVARSLPLQPGDEILTTDQEYGACNNAWQYLCYKTQAVYKQQSISLPITCSEKIVDEFWQGVTPNTRVIYLSHYTAPTALRLPIEKIIARARLAGIITVIDGAHAPGQLHLDLTQIGADFYTGNCHKWMLSPKGAGFLHVRPEMQSLIEPLVVSWGYNADAINTTGSRFLDLLSWTGTHDPAAYLSVPAAIQFMHKHHWDEIRQACHTLLEETLDRIHQVTQLPGIYPKEEDFYVQMGVAPLPSDTDLPSLQHMLQERGIEIPLVQWRSFKFFRISVQGYNSRTDMDNLVNCLEAYLNTKKKLLSINGTNNIDR
jgi:isopenicillin-N epimerase